jgi:2-polyprenyl-3-methyl-5-hydroxy-6-metoxy-1,4-benzoquinol methylase
MATATFTAPGPAAGPTPDELAAVFRLRFGDPAATGPLPRLWHRLGYFTPDVHYEALVAKSVGPGTAWLDVGCGRDVFPTNPALARALAARCHTLVGVDPDATIAENPFVHERVRCPIEEFDRPAGFDLITLRMVAEHITRPGPAVAALARLARPGGRVVVYTVNQTSPTALAARATPFRSHHAIKRLLWGTEDRDTFPVAYRMNSRRRLRAWFTAHGFREAYFAHLGDCRVFYRFRRLHAAELAAWRACSRLGWTYPENCLLGVYERGSA